MKIMMSVVLAAGLLSAGRLFAVTAHTFVNNSGDGDLAKATNWNPNVGEGAWATDEFRPLPGIDYTMSSSLSIGQVLVATPGRMVFPAGSITTLLTGDTSWKYNAEGVTNVFDGTTVSLAGTLLSGRHKSELILTNGATLACNGDRLKFAWGGDDSTMIVAGKGSSVTATGGNMQFGNGGSRNRIHIADGATATLATSGILNLGRIGVGNVIEVTGEGTTARMGNPFQIGSCNGSVLSGSHRLVVADKAYLTTAGLLVVGPDNALSPSNRVEISGGAALNVPATVKLGDMSPCNELTVDSFGHFTNAAMTVGFAATGGTNVIRVINGGVFKSDGAVKIGSVAGGNTLVISNGAEFVARSPAGSAFTIGETATADGNDVLIEGPATVDVNNTFVGYKSSNNKMTVRNLGGPFALNVYVGSDDGLSSGNVFEWTDSFDATGGFPAQFGAQSSDSVIRLRGITWRKIGASTDFGIKGKRNVFEFKDGAMWTIAALNIDNSSRLTIDNSTWDHNGARATGQGGTVTIGANNVSNVLEVVNGSSLVFTNGSTFAVASTFVGFTNTFNRVVVGDRSLIKIASNFRINRACNEFVISNGTFQFGTEFGFPDTLANRAPTTIALTNQVVRFYGAHPRMVVTGADMAFPYQESKNLEGETFVRAGYNEFHFDIPADGYVEPPIEATGSGKKVSFGRTHKIFVTGEILKTGGSVMLARGVNGVTVADMADLSSELPPRTKLELSDNGKELWLKVAAPGLTLILR